MHLFRPLPSSILRFHIIFYIIVTSPCCKHPINEHQGNFVNYQEVNFERDICMGDFKANEDIKNFDLPPDFLRLVQQ